MAMRRSAVVALLLMLAIPLFAQPAGARQRISPPPTTCDVTGSASLKRPVVQTLATGTRDKSNLITLSATLSNCRLTSNGEPFGVDNGLMTGKIKVPTTVTQQFLTAPTVRYVLKFTWFIGGVKLRTTKVKATMANPFLPLPAPGDPSVPVVASFAGNLGSSAVFGNYPFSLTFATSMVAPDVYAPGAPPIANFGIGSFGGEDSILVVSSPF